MDGEQFDRTTGEVIGTPGMPPAIAAAIIAVKKQVKQLGTDDKNEHGKYAFVSVDKFYERIGKLMAEAGLALLINEVSSEVKGSDKTGNPWLFVQYELTFMHETGAMAPPLRRSCALPISGPQAFGAAQSYIEKQFMRQVFKIPTGEKDADDTSQSEGAPDRANAARQTQGGAPPARSATQRSQAAPAPGPARTDADTRIKEIRGEITDAMIDSDLDGLDGSLAWVACEEKIALALRSEGQNLAQAENAAAGTMQVLRDRIAKRREMLAQPGGGTY